MNNFKPGDKVDWATNFNDNHLFQWPGVVIGTYQCTAGTVAQFYVRKKGDAKGRMRVKEWLVCHLKPHQLKPRYKLVPVSSLNEGDYFWSNGRRVHFTPSEWHLVYDPTYADKPNMYEGHTHVWKETTLQTYARTPSRRGFIDPGAGYLRHFAHLSRIGSQTRLDERKMLSRLMSWEGDSGTADPVQSPTQPRVTVRMTMGEDIKPGELVAVRVVDVPASMSTALALPGDCNLMVQRDRYYMVVNDVTK